MRCSINFIVLLFVLSLSTLCCCRCCVFVCEMPLLDSICVVVLVCYVFVVFRNSDCCWCFGWFCFVGACELFRFDCVLINMFELLSLEMCSNKWTCCWGWVVYVLDVGFWHEGVSLVWRVGVVEPCMRFVDCLFGFACMRVFVSLCLIRSFEPAGASAKDCTQNQTARNWCNGKVWPRIWNSKVLFRIIREALSWIDGICSALQEAEACVAKRGTTGGDVGSKNVACFWSHVCPSSVAMQLLAWNTTLHSALRPTASSQKHGGCQTR